MHEQHIVHGDIRLENILIKGKHDLKDGYGSQYIDIKLNDFRSSHNYNRKKIYVKDLMYYQPPEVCNQ